MQGNKRFYASRTVWANLLLGISILIQALTGEMWLDPEAQGAIIVIINLILRAITKEGLSL